MARTADRWLKRLFFGVAVQPTLLIVTGFNVRHRERLPACGPALVVANHNSHLDTLVLMSLFPGDLLSAVRPAAAADYFLRGAALSWFSTRVLGIVPVRRRGAVAGEDVLAPISEALTAGDIVIFFPEGTRGEAERLAELKSGIHRLARRHPEVPIVPVFLHGLGKSLPRGSLLPVPFFCDVFVGESLRGAEAPEEKEAFLALLQERLAELAAEGSFPAWD